MKKWQSTDFFSTVNMTPQGNGKINDFHLVIGILLIQKVNILVKPKQTKTKNQAKPKQKIGCKMPYFHLKLLTIQLIDFEMGVLF